MVASENLARLAADLGQTELAKVTLREALAEFETDIRTDWEKEWETRVRQLLSQIEQGLVRH